MDDRRKDQAERIVKRYAHLIEMQAGKAVRPYRADGYVNMMNKYGTSKDTTEGYRFRAEPVVPDELLTICLVYTSDRYEVAAVLNYGVVGGCREDLMADEPCLVDCVVHWQYDLSDVDGVPVGRYAEYPDRRLPTNERLMETASRVFPNLRHVCCASGDKFMGKAEEKLWLNKEFGAGA